MSNSGEIAGKIPDLSATIRPHGLAQSPHKALVMSTDSELASGMATGKHPILKVGNFWMAIVDAADDFNRQVATVSVFH